MSFWSGSEVGAIPENVPARATARGPAAPAEDGPAQARGARSGAVPRSQKHKRPVSAPPCCTAWACSTCPGAGSRTVVAAAVRSGSAGFCAGSRNIRSSSWNSSSMVRTIEQAANGRLKADLAKAPDLGQLAGLVLSAMTAQLGAAAAAGIEVLGRRAAQTSDCEGAPRRPAAARRCGALWRGQGGRYRPGSAT